ncbi:hypothetical protein [Candidatus Nitrospira salsa]
MKWRFGQLWVLLLLMTGCTLPITDGYHHELPNSKTQVIVWGNHPAVVETTTTWLQKHGLLTLDPTTIGETLKTKDIRWTHTFQDERSILKAAQELGVQEVVFANRYGDRRAPSVSVRGVDAKTNRLLWIGSGRYPEYLTQPENDIVTKLTCQALATAWGYRLPGKDWVDSSIERCLVDELQ